MATATPDLAPAPGFSADFADLIGRPYARGGRGPAEFDCYGLVMELQRRDGQPVFHFDSPKGWAEIEGALATGKQLWRPCKPGPGAIALIQIPVKEGDRFVTRAIHVAMVLPYGQLIHVWEQSGGVCRERIDLWTRRIVGYYRYEEQKP